MLRYFKGPLKIKERVFENFIFRVVICPGGQAVSGTAVRTALVYYCIHSG
jgi:hypothetical protein